MSSLMKCALPSPKPKCAPPGCADLKPSSLFQLHGRLHALIVRSSGSPQLSQLIGMIVVVKPLPLLECNHPLRA